MSTKLICGKFEEIDLKQKIDLSFLDPPDNEGRSYKDYKDKIPSKLYNQLLEKWISKACQITDGPVFISFAEKYIPIVENVILNNKINLIQRIWWYFTFGQANKVRYAPCCRPIYWLNKPTIYPQCIKIPSARQIKYKDKRAADGGKMPPNVWEFSRICGTFKERRSYHPTQHPEKLMERIILGHSKEEDMILDAFVGSGTSMFVCERLKRNCIGIDVSPFYINKIDETINNRK